MNPFCPFIQPFLLPKKGVRHFNERTDLQVSIVSGREWGTSSTERYLLRRVGSSLCPTLHPPRTLESLRTKVLDFRVSKRQRTGGFRVDSLSGK